MIAPGFVFVTALVFVSAVVWGLTTAVRCLDTRVEQWPLFWSIALWLCLGVPVLGLLMSLLPNSIAPAALGGFSFHAPLDALGLRASTGTEHIEAMHVWKMSEVKAAVLAVYIFGAMFSLFKLIWGRVRIRRLILNADSADIAGQDDVLISAAVTSPFAWTPFGRPQQSRILLPLSYRGVVSSAQIQDILMHERAHIARRDDECGLMLRVLLCLTWISPFAHGLFARWGQSTEIRCDMAVTANRDPKMRKAYADTLLQSLHIVAGRVRQYPAASFSTQRIRNEKMRIKHIMDGTRPAFKRRRDKAWLGATAVSLALMGAFTISNTAHAGPAEKNKAVNQVISPMVSGRLSSKYGPVKDPFKPGKTRNHNGIDIAAPIGTPIYAPADGIIRTAANVYNGKPAYGHVVIIETNGGVLTMFSHLDGYSVVEGQSVTKGTQIATVGNSGRATGPHVHIETRKNGQRVDPQSIWDVVAK